MVQRRRFCERACDRAKALSCAANIPGPRNARDPAGQSSRAARAAAVSPDAHLRARPISAPVAHQVQVASVVRAAPWDRIAALAIDARGGMTDIASVPPGKSEAAISA